MLQEDTPLPSNIEAAKHDIQGQAGVGERKYIPWYSLAWMVVVEEHHMAVDDHKSSHVRLQPVIMLR